MRPIATRRPPFRLTLPLLVAALIAVTTSRAPLAAPATTATQSRADAIERARVLVRAHQEELGIPGISAAVGIDGMVVWSEGFGYADLETREPARATTLYRIGSVSKPVTATAVVQLALDGRLDLDAPVQRYVPSFPEKGYPITTRQLAGHLAGIRHYRGSESVGEGQRHYDDVVDALGIFGEDPLLFAPGERYSYSSYGWNLISAVVQGAAGQDFLSYMQARVFDPLGMTHTHADDPRLIIPGRTRFYAYSGGRTLNAPFVDNSYKWAGGGFIASVEDLVRFGSAHLSPGFLPQDGLDLLFTSQSNNAGEEIGYGIGWRVGTFGALFPEDSPLRTGDLAGLRVMQHGGSSVGGRAFLLLVPEERMVVALLVNYSRFGGGRVAGAVAAAFVDR
jgi:CubicO group peptidase (beta-lactamase class C family)